MLLLRPMRPRSKGFRLRCCFVASDILFVEEITAAFKDGLGVLSRMQTTFAQWGGMVRFRL